MLRSACLWLIVTCAAGCASSPGLDTLTPILSAINLTNHPASDRNPAWSPDGSMIAFDTDRDGDWNIYVMNADGTNVRRVTSSRFRDRAPSWSPAGTSLVFQSNRNGSLDLYSIEVNTGFVIQLTDIPDDATEPSVSPDGSNVAFIASDRLYLLARTR